MRRWRVCALIAGLAAFPLIAHADSPLRPQARPAAPGEQVAALATLTTGPIRPQARPVAVLTGLTDPVSPADGTAAALGGQIALAAPLAPAPLRPTTGPLAMALLTGLTDPVSPADGITAGDSGQIALARPLATASLPPLTRPLTMAVLTGLTDPVSPADGTAAGVAGQISLARPLATASLRPLTRPLAMLTGQGDALAGATEAGTRTVAMSAAPDTAAPTRPHLRPTAMVAGQGDAALAMPLRPALRPLWIIADHGAQLVPAATPRAPGLLAQTAAAQTAAAQAAAAQTAAAQTAVAQTAAAQTVVAQTAVGQTAVAQTAVAQTAVAQTAVAQTTAAQPQPARALTEVALSTRGIALPLPRLARSERMTGDFPVTLATFVVPQISTGLRPLARLAAPAADVAAVVPAVLILTPDLPRPRLRPGDIAARATAQRIAAALVIPVLPQIGPQISELAIARSLRPSQRPSDLRIVPVSLRVAEPPRQDVRGALCGDASIQGEALGDVSGPGACGVENAVRVRSVGGVRLSEPGVMTCDTARALARWIQTEAKGVVGDTGGGLAALQVMGTYSCRARNGQSGERLSEHAFGHAIDIGGFVLNDGSTVSVLNNWGGNSYGRMLRRLHDSACGVFGTVLGPEANRYHRNHFHFDSASYRSGAYCR